MKKVILFSFVAFIAGQLIAQNYQSIALGSSIPMANIKMKDVTGNETSIKEATKKNGVLVMFSCNTCPYVIKNQQRIKEACAYALQNNIGVIILNSNEAERSESDSYKAMQAYAKAQGYQWNYVVDVQSKVANAFGANRTPEIFLFDAQGKLAYKGAIDDNPGDAAHAKHPYLKEAITNVSTGKEISVKESRSMGCGIKRN